MSKVTGVYSITNTVNGKRYIGSSIDISKRWVNHIWLLNHGTHHAPALQNSWKNRGDSAFKFEILLECSRESLIPHEQDTIDRYDTVRSGYNICPVAGNCLGISPSLETRAKLAEAGRKRKQTLESRAKMSATKKGVPLTEAHKTALRGERGPQENVRQSKLGKRNPNFGKPRSDETKRKIREANIRTWYTKKGLPIPTIAAI